MDFVLTHHHRLRPEALDDRAHVRAHGWTRQQHWRFPFKPGGVEALANAGDEVLKAARGDRELLFLAVADEGVGEGLLPCRREGDERQITAHARAGIAEL